MKVGTKLWRFDENHRVYEKSANGQSVGPLYRAMWRENGATIIGETSRSWLVAHLDLAPDQVTEAFLKRARKVSKTDPLPACYATSTEQVEEMTWVHDYIWLLTDAVRGCRDVQKLKKIAELVGYDPLKKEKP